MGEGSVLRVWLVGTDERLLERIAGRFRLEGGRAQARTFTSLPAAISAVASPATPGSETGPFGIPDVLVIDSPSGTPGWHLWLDALKSVHPDLAVVVLTACHHGGRVTPLLGRGQAARLHPRRVSRSLVAAILKAAERPAKEPGPLN